MASSLLNPPRSPGMRLAPPQLRHFCTTSEFDAEIRNWMTTVNNLRDSEIELLAVAEVPEILLDEHRSYLSFVLSMGETIRYRWKHVEAPLSLPFTQADFEATLEGLHGTWRRWHGPTLDPKRTEEILRLLDATRPA